MHRLLAVCTALAYCTGGYPMNSGDARVEREGAQWTFGTASVQRVVALEDGKLLLRRFRAGPTGRELVPPGAK